MPSKALLGLAAPDDAEMAVLLASLRVRAGQLEFSSRSDREAGEGILEALESGAGYGPDDPAGVAHGLIASADGHDETVRLLRETEAALSAARAYIAQQQKTK